MESSQGEQAGWRVGCGWQSLDLLTANDSVEHQLSGQDAPVVDSTGSGAPDWCVCSWGLPRATSGLLRRMGFA